MSTTEPVPLGDAVDVPDSPVGVDPGCDDPGDEDEGAGEGGGEGDEDDGDEDGGSSPPVHPPTASVATATPHTAYRIRRPTLTPPQAEIRTPNARKPT